MTQENKKYLRTILLGIAGCTLLVLAVAMIRSKGGDFSLSPTARGSPSQRLADAVARFRETARVDKRRGTAFIEVAGILDQHFRGQFSLGKLREAVGPADRVINDEIENCVIHLYFDVVSDDDLDLIGFAFSGEEFRYVSFGNARALGLARE